MYLLVSVSVAPLSNITDLMLFAVALAVVLVPPVPNADAQFSIVNSPLPTVSTPLLMVYVASPTFVSSAYAVRLMPGSSDSISARVSSQLRTFVLFRIIILLF